MLLAILSGLVTALLGFGILVGFLVYLILLPFHFLLKRHTNISFDQIKRCLLEVSKSNEIYFQFNIIDQRESISTSVLGAQDRFYWKNFGKEKELAFYLKSPSSERVVRLAREKGVNVREDEEEIVVGEMPSSKNDLKGDLKYLDYEKVISFLESVFPFPDKKFFSVRVKGLVNKEVDSKVWEILKESLD